MIGSCLRPQRRFPTASTATGATDSPDTRIKVSKYECHIIFCTFVKFVNCLIVHQAELAGQWHRTPRIFARLRPLDCQHVLIKESRWWVEYNPLCLGLGFVIPIWHIRVGEKITRSNTDSSTWEPWNFPRSCKSVKLSFIKSWSWKVLEKLIALKKIVDDRVLLAIYCCKELSKRWKNKKLLFPERASLSPHHSGNP